MEIESILIHEIGGKVRIIIRDKDAQDTTINCKDSRHFKAVIDTFDMTKTGKLSCKGGLVI